MKTLSEIENEMRELYPEKEIAYIDYSENTGSFDDDLRERLWDRFETLRSHWNKLVDERKQILNMAK